MKQGPRYYIKQRRRREGLTDYRKRLKLLKSRKIRIVVRNSLKNIRIQFIEYEATGDKILASAISTELIKNYNWKYSTSTTSAAYLTGILAAKRALDKGIKEGVLDIGRRNPVT
ncbi:MAG: 50S ribosomal protein L18, partial [Thermoplasmatales archaeon]|nr:50S ribosomal protein L18 [Thermoplasmatales archaeon]